MVVPCQISMWAPALLSVAMWVRHQGRAMLVFAERAGSRAAQGAMAATMETTNSRVRHNPEMRRP
jgi:hypothetical protein